MAAEDPIRILVLDRGFVFVCRCPDPEGHPFWLPRTHSRCVRRWGTERGLGQLAAGPTADTVLDDLVLEARSPTRAVLDVLEVNQQAWAPFLKSPAGATSTTPGTSSSRTGSRSRAGR